MVAKQETKATHKVSFIAAITPCLLISLFSLSFSLHVISLLCVPPPYCALFSHCLCGSVDLCCRHCSPVFYFFSLFTAHHWASLSVCLPNLHPKFQLFIYSQLARYCTVHITSSQALSPFPVPWNMLVFILLALGTFITVGKRLTQICFHDGICVWGVGRGLSEGLLVPKESCVTEISKPFDSFTFIQI